VAAAARFGVRDLHAGSRCGSFEIALLAPRFGFFDVVGGVAIVESSLSL
jgi:hypothetical protein